MGPGREMQGGIATRGGGGRGRRGVGVTVCRCVGGVSVTVSEATGVTVSDWCRGREISNQKCYFCIFLIGSTAHGYLCIDATLCRSSQEYAKISTFVHHWVFFAAQEMYLLKEMWEKRYLQESGVRQFDEVSERTVRHTSVLSRHYSLELDHFATKRTLPFDPDFKMTSLFIPHFRP